MTFKERIMLHRWVNCIQFPSIVYNHLSSTWAIFFFFIIPHSFSFSLGLVKDRWWLFVWIIPSHKSCIEKLEWFVLLCLHSPQALTDVNVWLLLFRPDMDVWHSPGPSWLHSVVHPKCLCGSFFRNSYTSQTACLLLILYLSAKQPNNSF